MLGSIEPPRPTAREVRAADPEELRRELADDLGVDRRQLFLTHGATEGNAAVLQFIARRAASGRVRGCRVAWPEYPDLADLAAWAGLPSSDRPDPAAVAVLTQPRNPEGDLWTRRRIAEWAEGARELLIDETFREFAGIPSLAGFLPERLWLTGTFTKFYAGDDLRVGFVVAPETAREAFARYHSLALDRLPNYSVAGARAAFRDRPRLRREVDGILTANRAAWHRAFPRAAVPRGPVAFDRSGVPDGTVVADRCLRASVLVCPGPLFGDPRGVRIGLTRRSFPADLTAYLAAREPSRGITPSRSSLRSRDRTARRRRAAIGRERAGRA